MACEICSRLTHEWYDCPKKPDGCYHRGEQKPSESTLHQSKAHSRGNQNAVVLPDVDSQRA